MQPPWSVIEDRSIKREYGVCGKGMLNSVIIYQFPDKLVLEMPWLGWGTGLLPVLPVFPLFPLVTGGGCLFPPPKIGC